ncbi:MAG TPA: BatA domain-containing protein [Bacteroidia bacterium]|nr:BatA domain-containing protein [Bacteroidia bacterium]
MNFLFPSFLYALSALSIPILIHLFNFRRYKKLYFSNVRFLQEVVQESRSKSRLRHWLVLLCRMLAIAFLVFAFAQPFIPNKQGAITAGNKAVSIFIDNSFSMNAVNQNGTLLEDAKSKAVQIAQSLNAADKVQLVSQDFDEAQERWLNKDEFMEELKGLKTSPFSRMMTEILQRQQENLLHSGSPVKEAFVLSDFQKTVSDISAFHADPDITIDLLPEVAETKNNVSIDTCWFTSPVHIPGKTENLMVKLSNYSANAVSNAPIKLLLNGEEKAISSFNIDAEGNTTIAMSFIPDKKNIQQSELKINDYPINFDDHLYFSFKLSTSIPVLWLHPDSAKRNIYLHSLYGKDSLFTFSETTAEHLDYSKLHSYRLIIIDNIGSISSGMGNELAKYTSLGGNIMIIPPASGLDMNSYRDFLSSINCSYYEKVDTTHLKVDKLNYESNIYADVFEKKQHPNMDMPVVSKHYTISHTTKALSENLLRLENGDDFLDEFHYNKGNIYLMAVPLNNNFSNFQQHALFVPTMYNIGLFSSGNPQLYYTLGDIQPIEAPNISLPQNVFFKIQSDKDTISILPERRTINDNTFLFLHSQLSLAGNFKLMAGDSLASGISFNYSRKESDLRCFTNDELTASASKSGVKNFSVMSVTNASLPSLLTEVNRGTYFWKYCILLALLFLAMEQVILRVWKD